MLKVNGQNHHTATAHDGDNAGDGTNKPFHLEAKRQPLLSRQAFARRFLRFGLLATAMIGSSLALGILGYHFFEGLAWSDALLNASMILAGMGPVDRPHTLAGKLFSSFYALFSGIVFLISIGVLLAPLLHRFMHRFHLELDTDEPDR
jgi:ABC-type phosphate transport system permease subunit